MRDVSNNLKLYRADILKTLNIEEPHFAANMETGLKPLLAGYDIKEVPMSWINRTVGMGASTFRIVKVAPGYFRGLMRTLWQVWTGRSALPQACARGARGVGARSMIGVEERYDVRDTRGVDRLGGPLFAGLSVVYALLTWTLSRRKLMWNDELYTYYIARLPSMHDVWNALMARGEQTPPLFFAITRLSFRLFGVNQFSIRLPEILAFWAMMVCVYVFARRRMSSMSALCAAAFPLVTTAFPYTYEARAYGLVLGFAALALLSWQTATSAASRARLFAVACLAASLAAAVSSHYYGVFVLVPLALGEAVRTVTRRRLDMAVWAALAISVVPLAWHLPLMQSSHGVLRRVLVAAAMVQPAGLLPGPADAGVDSSRRDSDSRDHSSRRSRPGPIADRRRRAHAAAA